MRLATALVLVAIALAGRSAFAQDTEIRIARGRPLPQLPMMVIERDRLVEKHAAALGIAGAKVSWHTFASPNVTVDAMLAGSVDVICTGVTAQVQLWSKTKGAVKGIANVSSTPLFFNTRNPDVKSIADLGDRDRIAVPGVKISIQALILQMAAAKAFGKENATKLDRLTVTLGAPDAMTTFLLGSSEINNDFTSPPYSYLELERPGIRRVFSSYDITGGPASVLTASTTTKFREANPRLYRAFLLALQEAGDIIRQDKEHTADIYFEVTGDKLVPRPLLLKLLSDPDMIYATVPTGMARYAGFMHEVGLIAAPPGTWKDLFFPEIAAEAGN